MMTQELSFPAARNDSAGQLIRAMDRIAAYLPPGVASRQFCLSLVAEANKLPEDTVPASTVLAGLHAAVIGLVVGPALGHAYLVPYRVHGTRRCSLVIGYRGFLELAFSCGFLRDVHCDVVLQGERFEFYKDETGPRLRHDVPLSRRLLPENVIGAYCLYHTVSGGHGVHVCNLEELKDVNTGKNVWASDPIAMMRKTPLRRASKEWRQTRGLAYATALDEQAEREEVQSLPEVDGALPVAPASDDPPIDLDSLPE